MMGSFVQISRTDWAMLLPAVWFVASTLLEFQYHAAAFSLSLSHSLHPCSSVGNADAKAQCNEIILLENSCWSVAEDEAGKKGEL